MNFVKSQTPPMSKKAPSRSLGDILRIAAAAQCDPRTVRSYLAGQDVRPLLKERIEMALKELKL